MELKSDCHREALCSPSFEHDGEERGSVKETRAKMSVNSLHWQHQLTFT